MRIIFLTITFYPEPNAIHGLPLAKWFAGRGHDIKVLTVFPQYPMGKIYPGYRMRPWQWEIIDGIRILRVPIYPSHDNSAIRRMLTYLSFAFTASTIGVALIGSADLVYLYDPPATNGLASLILKVFRRTPIVHDIADMWPETVTQSGMIRGERTKKIVDSALGAWCRFLYGHADAVTVLSPGFKRLLIERGVPENKIKVVYNWADETTFWPIEPDPALARELGFEGRFNIVYAGKLGIYQGIETVIKAAALIKDHPKIQVVIVGIGPKQEKLKHLASELGVNNVLFLGRRRYEEMPKINSLADVLLIHLRDHDFLRATIPGKTQVSLASSRPILMAVRGDAAGIVREAGAGIICEPEKPVDMARAMVELSRLSKEKLQDMGRQGRLYYLHNLSLDIAGKKLEAIFRSVGTLRQRNKPKMTNPHINQIGSLEARKLKEIEHSRRRRKVLQGFERHSDTNKSDEADNLDSVIIDKDAFNYHFSNMKFYSITNKSEKYQYEWLKEKRTPGVRVLDFGCGNGENGIYAAQYGAEVIGIDISPEGVANANLNAKQAGVDGHCRFEVMDGENMAFADNTFDLGVEYGVLHHVDLDKAMIELNRVLKPDSGMICVEALRHNPIIHWYRKKTPHLRTQWEVEHILGVEDLEIVRKYFHKIDVRFFHLAVLAAVPFRKTRFFKPVRAFLNTVDSILLRSEAIGKYGWIMIFTMSEPKK